MNLKKIIAFFLLAGTLCACYGGQETGRNVTPAEGTSTPSLTPEVTVTMPPEMTGTPSITEAPGNSPMPSVTEMPTPEPEKELLPIDAAHFTCGAFREFLFILYDVNQDGFLSLAEREAVEEIYWDDWYALEEMGISRENIEQPWHLDGFE